MTIDSLICLRVDRSAAGDLGHGSSHPNKRLQQTQAQVDEVVGIMKTNVEKVLERDQKLSELDDRADALQQGASQFEVHATKLKRKYWWQNLKVGTHSFDDHSKPFLYCLMQMMIILGGVGVIILIIIIGELMLFHCPHVSLQSFCSVLHKQLKSPSTSV